MPNENDSPEQDISLDEQIDGILENNSDNSNSEITTEETESKEGNENTDTTENQDNKQQIPEQFLNQDGTVNVDDLLKSYNELQPLADEKAKWEQEKTELQKQADYAKQIQEQALLQAQNLGYQNTEEYALITEIAEATANEYSKYLFQTT